MLGHFPIRVAACGARMFGYELRASAAGRLRPADLWRGRTDGQVLRPGEATSADASSFDSTRRKRPPPKVRLRAANCSAIEFAGTHFLQNGNTSCDVTVPQKKRIEAPLRPVSVRPFRTVTGSGRPHARAFHPERWLAKRGRRKTAPTAEKSSAASTKHAPPSQRDRRRAP